MKILAVDDDPEALQALAAILRALPGHEVTTASSGEEAFRQALAEGTHLLVTDVVMQPVDGLGLRDALLAQRPGLRTILLSEYDLSDYAEQIGQTPLLTKPPEPEALRAAVQQELAQIAAPAAVPRAAVPVATPRALPTATAAAGTPTATPRAAGSPAPGVKVPVARATAAPAAPIATATARPASPGVRAVPTAPPRAVAPSQVPAEEAAPAVESEAPAAAAVAPAAAGEHILGGEAAFSLLGQTIGGYQIVSYLGEGHWGPVFAAVQVAINRPVGLKVLDPSQAAREEPRQRFIADARAKASVQHPSILSVYEAGASEEWVFYTQEFVEGQHLAELAASGQHLDQPTALRVMKAFVEGMLYFERNNLPHTALRAESLYLSASGQPRLANLATEMADQQTTMAGEIEALGRAVVAVLPPGPEITQGLRILLARTRRQHPAPLENWEAFLQGVRELEPKIVPVEAARISAQDRAAVEAVEKARHQQKRAFMINVVALCSLLVISAIIAWFIFFRRSERDLTAQIHLAAGDFIMGEGKTVHQEEFWIDKYEVTIGEYAEFVHWIEKNPTQEHIYDHSRQPRSLSHLPGRPGEWEIYYKQALQNGAAHSTPIDLNCPMITATWWDAWAYARWKGRELPTEQEWERAARGTAGLTYPWGDEPSETKANTSADYNARDPGAKGKIDGANFWAAADFHKEDKSPDGVMGMAGNVSEWTASWDKGNQHPIIKGGSFALPLRKLSERIADKSPSTSSESIGFRTVTHTRPAE